MKKATKDVSMHQLIYVLFFSSIVHKVIFIPSRIVKIAFKDVWISVALFVALDVLHIILFYIVIKINPNLTLFEMMEKTLGKVAAKIVSGILALYLLIRVTTMITNYNLYATDVLYPVSWRPVSLPIIIVCVFCAYRGLRSVMRVLELLGTGVAIAIIATMVLVAVSSDITNILPILESGFGMPFKGFTEHMFFAGDYFCIMCIMGRIKVEKNIGINIAIPVFVASLLSVLFAMAYFSFYEDIAVFQKQGHALSDIALFLLGTESIARFDFIFSAMWIIAILLRIMVNTWVLFTYVQYTLGLSDSVVHKYIVSIIVIISTGALYAFTNANTWLFENIITGDFKYFVFIPLHFILPISIPFMAYFATKNEKKRQKNNSLNIKPVEEQQT
jgi:spore germination protein KB